MTDKEKAIVILRDERENIDLAISAIEKLDKIEKIIDNWEVDRINVIKALEHIRAIIDEEE